MGSFVTLFAGLVLTAPASPPPKAPPRPKPPAKTRAQPRPRPQPLLLARPVTPPPPRAAIKPYLPRSRPKPDTYRTVVVAAQHPEPLLDTPRSVDILNGREVLTLAPRSTPELLESVPGVVVQKTNHGGGSPFVRGLTGQHVLHMLDGVRLNNSTTRYGPNQMLNTVDPYTIRRLELLRGPGSLLYGSDAVGGVIYMLTRDARYCPGARYRWGGTALARLATADSSMVYNLGAWTQLHRVTVFAGGSFKNFNSLTGGRGIGLQDGTGYHEGDYDAAVTVHPKPGWAVKVATHGARQYDVPRTDMFKPDDFRYWRKQFRDLVYAKLSGRKDRYLDRLEVTLSYQRNREARERTHLGWDRIEFEDDFVHTVGLAYVAATDLGKWSYLTYGMDLYYDVVKSSQNRESLSTGEPLSNDPVTFRGRFVDGSGFLQGGLFLSDTLRPVKWLAVRAGGRFAFAHASIPKDPLAAELGLPERAISDASFGFGGGLSLTFIPYKSLRLIAAVQQAFRAPNLDDYSHVGSEGGGFDVPTTDLSPEQATSFELGVKWASGRLAASIYGHFTLLHDFIARRFTGYDVDGEPATERANLGNGNIAGFEADLRLRLPQGFFLAAWISYTHGDIRPALGDAYQPIRRMSPLQGLAAAGYRSRRLWAQVGLRWAARQDRLSPGDLADSRICPDGPVGCRGTPAFAIVSLAAGVKLGPHADFTVRVENLANDPYKYHGSGVYAPGLSAVGLLRVRK